MSDNSDKIFYKAMGEKLMTVLATSLDYAIHCVDLYKV